MPAFCAGTSISVEPVEGKILRYPSLGIVTPEEQSNVPSVFIRSVVGISALAEVSLGTYPPFAVTSMICFPSVTVTFFTEATSGGVLLPRAKTIVAPIIEIPIILAAIVTLFIRLEVKNWLDKTDDNKTVYQIEECEHNDNESSSFEEDSCFGTVLNTERAEAYQCEHGQCPKSEYQHGEAAFEEGARGQRIELHRLGESAGQEECRNTNQKRGQRVIKLRQACRMFSKELRHTWLQLLRPRKDI